MHFSYLLLQPLQKGIPASSRRIRTSYPFTIFAAIIAGLPLNVILDP
jgi:hypothetical protein